MENEELASNCFLKFLGNSEQLYLIFAIYGFIFVHDFKRCSGNTKSWPETVIENLVGGQGQPAGACNLPE